MPCVLPVPKSKSSIQAIGRLEQHRSCVSRAFRQLFSVPVPIRASQSFFLRKLELQEAFEYTTYQVRCFLVCSQSAYVFSALAAPPACQKSFFKADRVTIKWNSLGTLALIMTHTEVDKSNKSYYGETGLYLLSAAGNFDSRIVLGSSILIRFLV